jgi:hypothetical protein
MPFAYHYTSESIWHFGALEKNGLTPYHDLAGQKVIFAFMEPRPKSWRRNPEFPEVWRRLIQHVYHGDFSIIQCRFDIIPSDSVFVIDWAHMERVREEMGRISVFTASDQDHERVRQAKQRYLTSKTPLGNYRGGFSLPELIIANPIPASRIKEFGEYVTKP